MELTVLGKPALHFATSIYDEDLAILIWSGFIQFRIRHPEFDLTRQVFDNSADSLGFSALHYAVEARMNRFIRAVCSGLKQHTTELVASRIVTRDVTLPINTAQTIGKNIASGGCSLLHLAAKKGDLEMVKVLVAPPMCMDPKTLRDWDDNSPARMAAIYGHDAVAAYLENITGEAPLSILDVDNERMSREKKATKRFLTQLEPNKSMLEPFVCQKIWTIEETMLICKEVNRVAAKQGWCKERHTSYQTTDMPCHQVPTLSSWICSTLTDRMFPQITQRYKLSRTERLSFRDLFFVKYEARSGERSNLELHRDGSILSFNILLNSTDAFTGGGTYFDSTKRTAYVKFSWAF
ncbi:procollagen-2-oxoglutarate 5-dioxygenase [Plasmopara halstedii]|uniref:Procollagen-2-oxoglutarate 5-dioxygenase n=1 Tax=Plasmopara halstedii TaxID=4781 RepID=A0A0P1B267_PLAHL|nr:procollagen-2-oxoglutarate 5-dioxygenase [Plasmopara halstedii]CEG48108.1 procollagen-2-oxoglutarate 5-dioxygenase [Plasmopara halstedii]|eukprot:XP_024584477.1 procollagen-2-oxoglutarate 5-dioxygenase [Plasmopara halstedii]